MSFGCFVAENVLRDGGRSPVARVADSIQGAPHVGVNEIISYKKQRLVVGKRQRIGKAVAEVEPRRVAASSTIPTMGLASDDNLREGHRFNNETEAADEIVESYRSAWIR